MNIPILSRYFPGAKILAALSAITLAVTSCGGGGGSSKGVQTEPAPQTFHGLVLTVYPTLTFEFLAASSDATTGVETGAVIMTSSPAAFTLVNSGNQSVTVVPSPTISAGRYTYTRTSAETGKLVITGEGLRDNNQQAPNYIAYRYLNNNFTRTYDILFGTTGGVITGMQITDIGYSNLTASQTIYWSSSTIRQKNGGTVPVGWDSKDAAGLTLRSIYPSRLTPETMILTPSVITTTEKELNFRFLKSDFNVIYSSKIGDFEEQGTGDVRLDEDDTGATAQTFKYIYQPVAGQNSIVHIKIKKDSTGELIDYTFTFLDTENGTYTYTDATGVHTGTFEFPFLD